MKKIILSLMCLGAMTMATAQTKMTEAQLNALKASKSYNWVSIHDPSVVYNPSDKTYYIVGSHIGVGKSTDLVNWTGVNTGTDHGSFFNKSYKTAFSSCPTHEVQVKRGTTITTETLGSFDAGAFCSTYAETGVDWISGDMWAPDIIYNPNMKKWCLYLSLNGDYWASVIVLMTADKPTGPFTYQAPIVFGGFNGVSHTVSGTSRKVNIANTDMSLVTGSTSTPSRFTSAGSKWGTYYPNVIDPCVFFDEDGELWIAYGSWSGGIWMLKLDKETGLRDYTTTYVGTTLNADATSDQYYGKKIAGGYYVSGEGPYIQHIGNYYYLFMSYGGFAPDGGYEMRIFRSTSPTGPYKDASGNSAVYSKYMLNFGPNAATNEGMKIIGAMNDWGTMTVGECAEGHNSATLDPDGNAYVVYHTKFNNGTAGHQVRVRQLFQNEYGWLCASPFRFTGLKTTQKDIDSTRLYTAEQIAGTYQLLIHPYKLNHNNFAEATPVTVNLSADGYVTGDKEGKWEFTQEGKSYVKLTIGGVQYYGVVCEQNEDGLVDMPSICFTAVSNAGVPVWLYSYTGKAALADAYAQAKSYMNGPFGTDAPRLNHVKATYTAYTVTTPKELETQTLSLDGKYTPTTDGHKICVADTTRSLTDDCYFILGSKYIQKATVPGYFTYPMSSTFNTTSSWWTNFSQKDYVLKKDSVLRFRFYNYNGGTTNKYKNWCLYGANATHGTSDYKEYFGVRNDNWDNTTSSNTGCTNDYVWSTFVKDMSGAFVDMYVKYASNGTFTLDANITTVAGKEYHYSYTKTIADKPDQLTLFFVNEGSYIASGIPGDVNSDGKVDYSDVSDVLSVICGGKAIGNAYVTHSGSVDVRDVNAVISIICK